MAITREKAMYFWHRHLEGADPEKRTLKKWNDAFGKDPTTLDEIVGFIDGMVKTKKKYNIQDSLAMQLLCGEVLEKDLIPVKPKLKVANRTSEKE